MYLYGTEIVMYIIKIVVKAAEIVENAVDVQVYIAKNSTSCYIIIGWTML